jgi:hypothetical protein
VFDELARERQIVDVFEQEGDRLSDLRDLFRERISDTSYRAMTALLRRWLGDAEPRPDTDLEALGVLILGSLVNVHRSAWTFGGQPADLPEDRILTTWADLCVTLTTSLHPH